MFYFLLSNSSITKIKDPEKKLLTTFLYGSVLYIIFHAILNTSNKLFFQIIKTYYWTLLALDIFTLIFYYKNTFINLITKDGIVKKIINTIGFTLQNTFNNLADTSNYSNDIDFSSSVSNTNNTDNFEDVKCTLDNLKQKTLELENLQEQQSTQHQPQTQPQPILKKVSFNEKENTSHTISNDIKELNNNLQNLKQPTNLNTKSNETSSSIQEIRKKQNIDISNLQQYDNNTLLKNRDELSNSELENIKLNYNPNDLLNDIQYETEQKNELLNGNDFLSGNSNTKLNNNDIFTIQSTPISKINNLKNNTSTNNTNNSTNNNTNNSTNNNTTNNNTTDDDKMSVISSVSDLGSVLEFNLDEFEKDLS